MAKLIAVRHREETCFFDTCVLDNDTVEFFNSKSNHKSNYDWYSDDTKVFTLKEFHIPRYQDQEPEVLCSQASSFFESTTYESYVGDKLLFRNSILSTWPEVNLALSLDDKYLDPTTAIEVYGKFLEAEPIKAQEIIQSYERLLSPIHKVKWRLTKPIIVQQRATFHARLHLSETRPFYGRFILRGMLTRDVL